MENEINRYFLQQLPTVTYQKYQMKYTVPLIIFAWQHYGKDWKRGKALIMAANHFTQAGIMGEAEIFLVPKNLNNL